MAGVVFCSRLNSIWWIFISIRQPSELSDKMGNDSSSFSLTLATCLFLRSFVQSQSGWAVWSVCCFFMVTNLIYLLEWLRDCQIYFGKRPGEWLRLRKIMICGSVYWFYRRWIGGFFWLLLLFRFLWKSRSLCGIDSFCGKMSPPCVEVSGVMGGDGWCFGDWMGVTALTYELAMLQMVFSADMKSIV